MQLDEFYFEIKRFLKQQQEEQTEILATQINNVARSVDCTNQLLSQILEELKKQK